jgi:hypothetical protein
MEPPQVAIRINQAIETKIEFDKEGRSKKEKVQDKHFRLDSYLKHAPKENLSSGIKAIRHI